MFCMEVHIFMEPAFPYNLYHCFFPQTLSIYASIYEKRTRSNVTSNRLEHTLWCCIYFPRIEYTSVDIYREQQKQRRDESQDAFFCFCSWVSFQLISKVLSNRKTGELIYIMISEDYPLCGWGAQVVYIDTYRLLWMMQHCRIQLCALMRVCFSCLSMSNMTTCPSG